MGVGPVSGSNFHENIGASSESPTAKIQQLVGELVEDFNNPNLSDSQKMQDLANISEELNNMINALHDQEPNNNVLQQLANTMQQLAPLVEQFMINPSESIPMSHVSNLINQLEGQAQQL